MGLATCPVTASGHIRFLLPNLPVFYGSNSPTLREIQEMFGEMIEAQHQWLQQFARKTVGPTPAIEIPPDVKPVEVPLAPTLAITNRSGKLAQPWDGLRSRVSSLLPTSGASGTPSASCPFDDGRND